VAQLQGVLSDVCSALRACADILPDLITWGPGPGDREDALALMLGAARLRPQCWRAAALLARITWGPAQVIAKTLSH